MNWAGLLVLLGLLGLAWATLPWGWLIILFLAWMLARS